MTFARRRFGNIEIEKTDFLSALAATDWAYATIAMPEFSNEILDGWQSANHIFDAIKPKFADRVSTIGDRTFYDFKQKGATATVIEKGDTLILSFRGTSEIKDIPHYIDFIANSNYIRWFTPLLNAIASEVSHDTRIIVTGHSLGGAAVNLMANALQSNKLNFSWEDAFAGATFIGFESPYLAKYNTLFNFGVSNDTVYNSARYVADAPGFQIDSYQNFYAIGSNKDVHQSIFDTHYRPFYIGVLDRMFSQDDVDLYKELHIDSFVMVNYQYDAIDLNNRMDVGSLPKLGANDFWTIIGRDDETFGDKITALNNSKPDWMFGFKGDDYLDGRGGNDILSGGDGNDTLIGGDGDDVLYGGAGANVLQGGAGSDTYYISSADDLIQDVSDGTFNDVYLQGVDWSNKFVVDAADVNWTPKKGVSEATVSTYNIDEIQLQEPGQTITVNFNERVNIENVVLRLTDGVDIIRLGNFDKSTNPESFRYEALYIASGFTPGDKIDLRYLTFDGVHYDDVAVVRNPYDPQLFKVSVGYYEEIGIGFWDVDNVSTDVFIL